MSPFEWIAIISIAMCALAIAMWYFDRRVKRTRYPDIEDIENAGLKPRDPRSGRF